MKEPILIGSMLWVVQNEPHDELEADIRGMTENKLRIARLFMPPSTVTDEVHRCISAYCGNPGRGAHPLAMRAAEKSYECREALAAFFDAGEPERVIFTLNTTQNA